jgi:hypothetical protein
LTETDVHLNVKSKLILDALKPKLCQRVNASIEVWL